MINAQFTGHNFAMDQLFQIFSHHILLKSHSGHSSCSYLALFSLSKPGCLPVSSAFFLFPGQDTSTNLMSWSLLALFAFCCIFTCVVNRLSIIKQKWFHWKEFRHVFTIGQWIVWHFIVCISNQCIFSERFTLSIVINCLHLRSIAFFFYYMYCYWALTAFSKLADYHFNLFANRLHALDQWLKPNLTKYYNFGLVSIFQCFSFHFLTITGR